MNVILFVVFALTGQDPIQHKVPMPDLKTCVSAANHILDNPPPEMWEGGMVQAGCVLMFEKQPRA